MRRSLLEGAGVGEQVPTVGILVGMGAVLIPLGILVFSWAERRAKRLGLLKRSG
jgi:ABC-2 type transport system permease protein